MAPNCWPRRVRAAASAALRADTAMLFQAAMRVRTSDTSASAMARIARRTSARSYSAAVASAEAFRAPALRYPQPRGIALENTVLTGLSQRLLEPELFKVFCEEFYRELNKARVEDGAALQVQARELEKIGRRIRKIVEIITDDDAPVKSLKEELRELELRQEQIETTLATAKSPEPLIHPNLAEIYRRKVEALRTAIADPASRDEAFELIRSLIEAVVVVPVGKGFELEIKGDLAGILQLCEAGRKAKPGTVSSDGLAEQLKMVAGACNQRYLRLAEAWL